MKKNKKGFTLIELLVVIAIIGLLSTLAVVSLSSARRKARDSKRVADVKQIQMALEMYFDDHDGYPEEATAIELGVEDSTDKLCAVAGGAGGGFENPCTVDGATEYLGVVPAPPSPADGDDCEGLNLYSYSSDGNSYLIDFCLGGKTGTLKPGPREATPAGIE